MRKSPASEEVKSKKQGQEEPKDGAGKKSKEQREKDGTLAVERAGKGVREIPDQRATCKNPFEPHLLERRICNRG